MSTWSVLVLALSLGYLVLATGILVVARRTARKAREALAADTRLSTAGDPFFVPLAVILSKTPEKQIELTPKDLLALDTRGQLVLHADPVNGTYVLRLWRPVSTAVN